MLRKYFYFIFLLPPCLSLFMNFLLPTFEVKPRLNINYKTQTGINNWSLKSNCLIHYLTTIKKRKYNCIRTVEGFLFLHLKYITIINNLLWVTVSQLRLLVVSFTHLALTCVVTQSIGISSMICVGFYL